MPKTTTAVKKKSKSKVTPGRVKKTREDWQKDVVKKRIKLDKKVGARKTAKGKKKPKGNEVHKELVAQAKQLPALRVGDEPTEKEIEKLGRSKKNLAKFKGTFKKYVPESKMLFGRQEVGSGGALIQRGLLMQLLDLIPVAEDAYIDYPSQSNAYALNTLISSAREVLAEIEAQNDGTQLSISLVQEILMPSFQEIAQMMVLAIYALRESMLSVATTPQARDLMHKKIDEAGTQIRTFLGDKFTDIREKVVDRIHKG